MLKINQEKEKDIAMNNKKAFTMVELLATITLLGILMAVGIVGVSSLLKNGRDNYIKTQKKNLIAAAQQYFNFHPEELSTGTGTVTYQTLKDNKYIGKVAGLDRKTPCDGNSTKVTVTKRGTKYQYVATLHCNGINDSVSVSQTPAASGVPQTSQDKLPYLKSNGVGARSTDTVQYGLGKYNNKYYYADRFFSSYDGERDREDYSGYRLYEWDGTKWVQVYESSGNGSSGGDGVVPPSTNAYYAAWNDAWGHRTLSDHGASYWK